ncbi:alpha-(1,3)-fucosyltransferase C-like [Ruditapes philippinarum]|uniref:alpha-(1,3)-fucosyltransferase C-like n=1 Tax=Ruditapes philippinarum TaxID=129788 RepID=UPI00295B92F0|nr:alpha-(1,3)-fucosyltransferase C-like [Ruditapes philippinarum]
MVNLYKWMVIGTLLMGIVVLLTTSYYMQTRKRGRMYVKAVNSDNKLVDVQESKSCSDCSAKNKTQISILFINKPRHMNILEGNQYLKSSCYFKNCILTDFVKNISEMSAIVFNAQDNLPFKGEYLKQIRKESQIWIIYRAEPIAAVRTRWFREKEWKNTMNWTMGYRLDSDIFLPHQLLVTRKTQIKRDYVSVYNRKTKMAAWIVSHCHADSLRDEYVRALIKEGIEVDIYGKCSKNRTRVRGRTLYERIDKYYKFYLSFENNFCLDYVSEKFFNYISLDTILIVRGGLNYSKHFDKNAFIDASSFSSVKSLANYMLSVSNDVKLFTKFLQAKDKYIVNGTPGYSRAVSTCRLCEHMNNKDKYIRTYKDIADYLENGTCFNPKYIV